MKYYELRNMVCDDEIEIVCDGTQDVNLKKLSVLDRAFIRCDYLEIVEIDLYGVNVKIKINDKTYNILPKGKEKDFAFAARIVGIEEFDESFFKSMLNLLRYKRNKEFKISLFHKHFENEFQDTYFLEGAGYEDTFVLPKDVVKVVKSRSKSVNSDENSAEVGDEIKEQGNGRDF